MTRTAGLIVFVALIFAVLGGVHYFLWARLVRDTRLPAPWSTLALGALIAFAVAIPATLIVGRFLPAVRRVLIWPAYIWMGVMFLLFVTVLAGDLVRLLRWTAARLARDGGDIDVERRTMLARVLAFLAVGLATGIGLAAVRSALGQVQVRRVRVALARLPRAHDGLRIVQLTDMHVGPTRGRAFVEDIVRRTNALGPDIVAITGDLVDGSVEDLREDVAPLGALRARFGVYFVTGNHEYFSGAPAWSRELSRIGLRVLHNARVSLGEGEDSFDLAGVDDYSAHRYGGLAHGDALRTALDGRDTRRELVLLAHQPKSLLLAEPFGVGLQLSGHTHGGQIWPFNFLVRLQQPFVAGLHRHGASQIYVSRGTGFWGPPMRVAAPAEITEIIVVAGSAVAGSAA